MESKQIRWLHASDLHVGKDPFGFEMMANGLLAFLRARKLGDKYDPDLFLFTGDIANKGKPSEYALFNDKLLLPLLTIYGDSFINKIVFVPGNHDIDRDICPLIDTYPLPERHPKLMDPTETSHQLRQSLAERFGAFCDALPEETRIRDLLGKANILTKTLTIKNSSVGLLGINTAWLSQSPRDKECLIAGHHTIALGLQSLATCDLRIVLGHHPLNWLRKDEAAAIHARFAEHNIIYLHGHLHEMQSAYQNNGGRQFLDIQAGALFDSRESKTSPNTIILGSFLPDDRAITLEPFRWSPDNQEWTFSTEGMPESQRVSRESRYWFPLPTTKVVPPIVTEERLTTTPPPGWVTISRAAVSKWTEAQLSGDQVLGYFDGRPPTWADAASFLIPSRAIVAEIVNEVVVGLKQPSVSVILITGPSGEGKSTVLRQACCAVLRREPETKVLFRNDDNADFPREFALNHLDRGKMWLIVADDAGNLADSLYFQSELFGRNLTHKIVYLISARDTDWYSNGGQSLVWSSKVTHRKHLLRGLSTEDAHSIVSAWAHYGKQGLQKLTGLTIEDAAQALYQSSLLEEEPSEGAFLGAMLRVRYGRELLDHLDSVMQRLKTRAVITGFSLLDIFAVIVAMHKLRVRVLNKQVLSEYLGTKESELRRHALAPLGDETVVSTGGHHILTRHSAIADVAFTILESKYDYDFNAIYKDLALSAMDILKSGRFLLNAGKWRYLSTDLY